MTLKSALGKIQHATSELSTVIFVIKLKQNVSGALSVLLMLYNMFFFCIRKLGLLPSLWEASVSSEYMSISAINVLFNVKRADTFLYI